MKFISINTTGDIMGHLFKTNPMHEAVTKLIFLGVSVAKDSNGILWAVLGEEQRIGYFQEPWGVF